jgi:ABC-type phosphate transport system substrate-binding protein
MTRSLLLGAASAAALLASTGAFAAQPAITGGGSTLAEFDYFVEFAAFNAAEGSTKPIFSNAQPSGSAFAPANSNEALYWASGSGTGQNSFLYNNLTCDANKTLKTITTGTYCTDPASVPTGTVLETLYGASDATLTSTQYAGWTNGTSYVAPSDGATVSVPAQQPIAGNLIELPSMGVGVSFPIVNSGVTANAQVSLQDSDICGIFSGKITNWSTIAAESYNKGKKIASGTIQVVFRSDSSGTTFILTEHLAKACNSSNSLITFTPVLTFSSLFPSGVPSNFVGESGSSGIANFISGYAGGSYTGSEISYLSPDFTTIDPNSNATLTNASGQSVKSTLVVAGVYNPTTKKYIEPDVTDIGTALTHVLTYDTVNGSSGVPASVAQAEANNAFVQVPTSVGAGYPYVGYTTFDFAQCYKTAADATAVVAFLNAHYKTASYLATEKNNGFVAIANSGADKYLTSIVKYIFPQAGKGAVDYGTEIGSVSGCKGLAGR